MKEGWKERMLSRALSFSALGLHHALIMVTKDLPTQTLSQGKEGIVSSKGESTPWLFLFYKAGFQNKVMELMVY